MLNVLSFIKINFTVMKVKNGYEVKIINAKDQKPKKIGKKRYKL